MIDIRKGNMLSNNGFPSHFKETLGVGKMITSETNVKMIRIQKRTIKRFKSK